MATFSRKLGRESNATTWNLAATRRKKQIQSSLWSEDDGLYYDLNYVKGELKRVKSLATFFPLFAGIASSKQAARVVSQLKLFEREFGLSTCDKNYGFADRQWNSPVGWAPLHWIVFVSLKNYGYYVDAARIATKWLNLMHRDWQITEALFEKYDVVSGSSQVLTDRYKNQQGFGWTNGVYLALSSALKRDGQRVHQ